MLNMLIVLFTMTAFAHPKYESFDSQALLGATVLKVSCSSAGTEPGRVLVVRDQLNFEEHTGTLALPVTPAECLILEQRVSSSLRCFGEARIDLFLEHAADGLAFVVDCGFPRRLGMDCK